VLGDAESPSSRRAPIRFPKAQLDRFLMQIDVLYPDIDASAACCSRRPAAQAKAAARAYAVPEARQLMQIRLGAPQPGGGAGGRGI
jgi:MoxR-like ATPase